MLLLGSVLLLGLIEPASQGSPCAGQLTLGRAVPDSHEVSDLVVSIALDVVQDENLAVAVRQLSDRAFEIDARDLVVHPRRGSGLVQLDRFGPLPDNPPLPSALDRGDLIEELARILEDRLAAEH